MLWENNVASTAAHNTHAASCTMTHARNEGGIALWMRALVAFVLCGLLVSAALYPHAASASVRPATNASLFSNSTGVFEELRACKGKTADEALDTARTAGVDANFKDSADANVTEIVEDKSNGSKIHDALVTDVKTYNYWIFGRYVTFILAYNNPDELAAYQQKAADKAAREEASKNLDACVGMTADEAYELAQIADCKAKFLDSADVDVTSIVADAENGSDVHEALVVEVTDHHSFWFFGESITFRLEYTEPVSKKKRDEKAAQEKSKTQAAEELKSCEGKPAREAYELADILGYEVSFFDRFDVDVTKAVVNGGDDSEAAAAAVTKVEVKEPSFLSPGSVTITLDYVDPDAEYARNEGQLRTENREEILNSKGKSAGKTQELVESSGYALQMLDKYGVNITNAVRNAQKGSGIRRALVTSVSIDNSADHPLVIVDVDYVDLSSAKKIAQKDGASAEVTVSDYRVKVKDEKPSAKSPTFLVTVKGTITNNDTWIVSADTLPALGVNGKSFDDCAQIQLDNGVTSLKAGESCAFTYQYRVSYTDPQAVLQTKVEGAQVHNGDRMAYKTNWWITRAKRLHDTNLATSE